MLCPKQTDTIGYQWLLCGSGRCAWQKATYLHNALQASRNIPLGSARPTEMHEFTAVEHVEWTIEVFSSSWMRNCVVNLSESSRIEFIFCREAGVAEMTSPCLPRSVGRWRRPLYRWIGHRTPVGFGIIDYFDHWRGSWGCVL